MDVSDRRLSSTASQGLLDEIRRLRAGGLSEAEMLARLRRGAAEPGHLASNLEDEWRVDLGRVRCC